MFELNIIHLTLFFLDINETIKNKAILNELKHIELITSQKHNCFRLLNYFNKEIKNDYKSIYNFIISSKENLTKYFTFFKSLEKNPFTKKIFKICK